jgi:hypothetical protein
MIKWFLVILMAVFSVDLVSLRACDEAEKRRDERKKLEQREGKGKDGKTNAVSSRREQSKKMTPEERAAKRKELEQRLEKRIAELRAKETNATITPQEKRELERRVGILKRFKQSGLEAPRERPSREPAAPLPPKD